MSDPRAVVIARAPVPDWADPWVHPELFQGVAFKRVIAYAIDVVLVGVLAATVWFAGLMLALLSFGLLFPLQALAVALVPLAYHSLQIAGRRSATIGMRVMGLKVVSVAPDVAAWGGRPTLFQAMILTVAFYGSVALTGSLILLIALFNARRRTLHDWLAGTVVVNDRTPGNRSA